MAHTDTIELFPYGQTDVRKDDIGPAKRTVILIRWAVVILCSYLIIHRVDDTISSDLLNLLVALYMVTNVALYSIKEEFFTGRRFTARCWRSIPSSLPFH